VEQELLTLSEHLSSPPDFSGIRVTQSLVLSVCFVDHCPFLLFLLAIVLSVLLRFTDSDYHFDIFKLFLARRFTIIVIIQVLGMFVAINLHPEDIA